MVWLAGQLIRECVFENKQEAVTFANKVRHRMSFDVAREQQQQPSDSDGDVEMMDFENPMEESNVTNELKKQSRKKKMQKVRKKLSIGVSARNQKSSAPAESRQEGGKSNPLYVAALSNASEKV